jgi:cell division transport system permease protein
MAARSFLPAARRSMLSGFVAGIVAVLVFVSGLALATAGVIDGLIDTWNRSVTGTLTVQIPGEAAAAAGQAEAVVRAVTAWPGGAAAEIVPRARVRELLRPWLGDERLIADLPLPVLVDVRLAQPSTAAAAAVTALVKTAAPAAVIDDHRVWLGRIADFAAGLNYIALALMAMSLAALVLTVMFATRASLTEYVQTIELLHLVGARDGAIALQFAWRALGQTLWGGAVGFAVFIPALAGLGWLAGRIDPGVLPPLTLPLPYWIALAALPLAAGAIAFLAALLTVRRVLTAMV